MVKKREEESKALLAENKSALWSDLDLCNKSRGPTLNLVDLLYGHRLLHRSSAMLAHLHPSCGVCQIQCYHNEVKMTYEGVSRGALDLGALAVVLCKRLCDC